MKLIRSFFNFSRIFWIVSRLVLGLIFCYCAIFLLEGANTLDYLIAGMFGVLALALMWSFIVGIFAGGASKWLRIATGIALVLLSMAAFYSMIDAFGMGTAALILILPVWLFMAGIFELLSFNSRRIHSKKNGWTDVSLN